MTITRSYTMSLLGSNYQGQCWQWWTSFVPNSDTAKSTKF